MILKYDNVLMQLYGISPEMLTPTSMVFFRRLDKYISELCTRHNYRIFYQNAENSYSEILLS